MMFTSSFNLDLSEASIIEIIDAFVDFKRKFNPDYKPLNLRSIIPRAEQTFKCTLKPEQIIDILSKKERSPGRVAALSLEGCWSVAIHCKITREKTRLKLR